MWVEWRFCLWWGFCGGGSLGGAYEEEVEGKEVLRETTPYHTAPLRPTSGVAFAFWFFASFPQKTLFICFLFFFLGRKSFYLFMI